MYPRLRAATVLAGLLLLSGSIACSDPVDPERETPAAVASVTVTPGSHALALGETVALTATPRDANGNPLAQRTVAFASADQSIATVSTTGLVTAIAVGVVRITATSEGRSAQSEITVNRPTSPPPAVVRVTLDATSYTLLESESRRVVATPRDADGAPIAGLDVEYMSDDAGVASVSADGTVTAANWGTTRITARVGNVAATATVQVAADLAYDLLYDVSLGDGFLPRLLRLDIRLPGSTAEQVFGSPGTWGASASPDGARIAFTCSSDGPAICVANRDGSGVVVLTSGPANEDQPAWSPDGTMIGSGAGPPAVHPGCRIARTSG
jgi:hypothetical protein